MIEAKVIIGDSRKMVELNDSSIDLVVTSPPYWHIKNYNVEGQIGFGQSLHEYLKDLYLVWKEIFRVLKPGSRLVINIGDQFLRKAAYGRYKVIPLHSEVILQCDKIGFDYLGSIIWQKKTTLNTTGGASVMGSYPYPSNGIVEIDYEFIMIFKKPGERKVNHKIKENSKIEPEEWKEYFKGHWHFGGKKQGEHKAMFPDELPKRIIKMFSFKGDTVLDPFLGSGTTMKSAISLERNSVGYEINNHFLKNIVEKVGTNRVNHENINISIYERKDKIKVECSDYVPCIGNFISPGNNDSNNSDRAKMRRVKNVLNGDKIQLDNGLVVRFLGVKIREDKNFDSITYLNRYVKGREVNLKYDEKFPGNDKEVEAYVYLKNRIFINKELIKKRFADVAEYDFKYSSKFSSLIKNR